MNQKNLIKRKEISKKALLEAEERRRSRKENSFPKEYGGRGGLDPVRYKDWEVKGIVSDF